MPVSEHYTSQTVSDLAQEAQDHIRAQRKNERSVSEQLDKREFVSVLIFITPLLKLKKHV